MGDKSSIEWCSASWNPIAGCSKVSSGCKNCYAIKDAHRLAGNPNERISTKYANTTTPNGKNWTGVVNLDEGALTQPMRWTRPRLIFVNSMSDLFHDSVTDLWIDKVFAVMAMCPQHTFQVLTKRPARMRLYLERDDVGFMIRHLIAMAQIEGVGKLINANRITLPLRNVWLGVSVENQEAANERVDLLCRTLAARRFLSCEPMLGAIDIPELNYANMRRRIDWVIAGGESGGLARPSHPDWFRHLRDQCQAAGVSFFFKQHGEFLEVDGDSPTQTIEITPHTKLPLGGNYYYVAPDGEMITNPRFGRKDVPYRLLQRVGKRAAGRMLDGREWNEMPEVQSC